MINPFLADTVERVGRDVERKLGWEDRLIGTLRLGLSEGVRPIRYALGVAAALAQLEPAYLDRMADPSERLAALWGDDWLDPQAPQVRELIREALERLHFWKIHSPGDPLALLKI